MTIGNEIRRSVRDMGCARFVAKPEVSRISGCEEQTQILHFVQRLSVLSRGGLQNAARFLSFLRHGRSFRPMEETGTGSR